MIEEYATGAIRWRRVKSAQFLEYQVVSVVYTPGVNRRRFYREWRAV